jgi:hypothetical protein
MSNLHELKKEADELGVTYAKNISAPKLAEKIDAFYASKETSTITIEDPAPAEEPAPTEKPSTDKVGKEAAPMTKEQLFNEKRRLREEGAKKTRIVSIVDNDQRVNNHTTTCTVNCSNEYFDLGTRILPLNEKIEVCMGHIRTLEDVQIPLHVVDSKTGMSTVRMRPRYTISYENQNNQ